MSLLAMRRKMQYVLPFFVWAFVFIFAAGAFFAFNPFGTGRGNGGPGQGVFARIGGQEIAEGQFAMLLQQQQEQFRMFAQYGGQPVTIQQMSEAPRYAYQQLIESYAEAAAAEAAGVSVSYGDAEAEARRQVDQQIERVGQGVTQSEIAEMRQQLSAHVDVDSIRRQLLSQRLREKLAKEARPVEVKVAHALFKTDTRSPAVAFKLAQATASQARAGADFAKLARDRSEDLGSKVNGGVVGWASAMPPAPPTGKGARPNPDAATQFVPEFTGASLRLKPGQVSDPVKSSFGYHVIKALEERSYQPTDKESLKDPKKRGEAIESYKSTVANQEAEALFSAAREKIEASMVPVSPWLKGYLAEQQSSMLPPPAPKAPRNGKAPKAPKALPEAQKLSAAITNYALALKSGDPAAGPGLAFKLAQLHQRAGQDPQALEVLEKWTKRSGDAEMYFMQGETLEKLQRKTDALTAYEGSMGRAFNNPALLARLADRFKTLGHNELAEKARDKQSQQLARQAEERKRRDEQMKKAIAEQTAKSKQASTKISTTGKTDAAKTDTAKSGPAKKDDGQTVGEIEVKTGPVDPKTGKPTILSVKKKGSAEEKPGEKEKTPAKP